MFFLTSYALCANGQQQTPVNVGQSVILHSKILSEDRNILIYLPEGYKESTASYPVIYLMDAETHWFHTGSTVAFLSLLGKVPKAIVVGVINTDRARDMTPKPAVADKDFPGGGGAVKFLAFINDELKPYIVSHYRTDPFAILAGTSLSGLFVINSFIAQPAAFNAYIAASPSLWWDKRAVAYKAIQMLKTPFHHNSFLFLSLCDGDSKELAASTQYFIKALKSRITDSLHWQYIYIPGEDHNSSPLKSFYAGLQWLYTGWAAENTSTLAKLKQHYELLSRKYEYPIAIPETDINNLGYSMLFSENRLQAIPIFRLNTEKYPASANAWDSLGDAYKLNNRLDSAKMAYERGCTIGKQTNNINAPGMCANLDAVIKMIGEKTKNKKQGTTDERSDF